ncbi:hypothetical protein [Cellulosilyticum sp. I15G10I2]|uniref:hypothetical protein n=1 Tax=Cellulosilyticum sp. I15G10I2 TaxID=1892843 RepID=UPI00085C85CA|nr:hypothetical protein [Cellulosilyticum sp. I15G10I2]
MTSNTIPVTLTILIVLFILIILIVGTVWLQIYLSRRKSKWLGLILPLIFLLFSITNVLGLSMYYTMGEHTTITSQAPDGTIIYEETKIEDVKKPSIGEVAAMAAPVFLTTNIPTIILLGIYLACREKQKKNEELEKMNIQDLE